MNRNKIMVMKEFDENKKKQKSLRSDIRVLLKEAHNTNSIMQLIDIYEKIDTYNNIMDKLSKEQQQLIEEYQSFEENNL